MKFLVILATLLLFGCSNDANEQKIKWAMEEQRISIQQQIADAELLKAHDGDWEISESQYGPTVMYNRKTGEAWRYYRNEVSGKLEDEGFVQLAYRTNYGRFDMPKTSSDYTHFAMREEEKKKSNNVKGGDK